MKIYREVNGIQFEFELTDNERMRAYEEQEHVFDVDYIQDLFGKEERFNGMTEDEKARVVDAIAYKYRDKMTGTADLVDRFEVACEALDEVFDDYMVQKYTDKVNAVIMEKHQDKNFVVDHNGILFEDDSAGKGRYGIEVTIDVVGGPEEELCVKMAGNDLEELLAGILPAVQKACAEQGYLDNQVVVGVLIEENGEWLDSDEETLDLSELNIWICSYKDSLGYLDNGDNVTDILVPKAWLLEKLKAEGETDFEAWNEEYTADNTDMIARDAVSEGMVLSCADKRISCVLGLGESFLNTNDYGKRLAMRMREIYKAEYDNGDYLNEGTDIISDVFVNSPEDAAGWCLLTYGDRALQEVQEWIGDLESAGFGETTVFGFDIYDVCNILECCIVPVKDNSLETRLEEATEKSEVHSDSKTAINLDEYEYISNVDGYSTFRKIVPDGNGGVKGIWAARHQDGGEPFEISYAQARGFEPIEDSPIKRLSRQLGEMLLP